MSLSRRTVGLAVLALGSMSGAFGPAARGAEAPATQPAAAPKEAAPQAHFAVYEYRVLGNTVMSNRDIERVLYPLLGDDKTLSDVELARVALEKTYHDQGFGTVFVDIPEQDVSDHVVRLKVTEGRLHSVSIGGARYYSERKIMTALPAATVGSVPNLPELQKELSAVNQRTADRSVVPVLKAGPLPGTVDLSLKVNDHPPLHGSVEINNQSTPYTEPLRTTVALSYDNLFGRFDSFSAQFQVAPQNVGQVNVFAANYAWGSLDRFKPSVFFINSNSDVATVGTLGVLGKGQIFGARLSSGLGDALASPQSLTFGVDYKHFKETIGLPNAPAVVTPISYVNLSLAYAGGWSTDPIRASFSCSANFGPRGWPNDSTAFANKRFQGQSNYFYLKLDGTVVAMLPKGFEAILRADGQFAAEPLITNENFAIAGADGVRGYLEAEVLADSGMRGSVQLQTPSPQLDKVALGNLFVFYDAGRADVASPLPGETAHTVLRSYGAGLNLLPGKWITGTLTWANPLKDGPNTRHGASRILFVVRGSF